MTGARRIRRRRHAIASAAAVVAIAATGIAISNFGAAQTLPPANSLSNVSPTPSVSTTTVTPSTVIETHIVTVTVDAPATVPEVIGGPVGYGKLKLGMSQQEAQATGVLVEPSDGAACPAFASQSVPSDKAAVVISPKAGVSRITLPGFAKTSTGVGAGSSASDVKAKYPNAVQQEKKITVAMQGQLSWRFVFLFDNAQKVSVVRMELTTSDCPLS
ncbi:hypothetical protein Lesp02_47810 [Lentzea sp. NBRC 105346]|nr:hypothetical protein Lesp02_47810 [Lentzea sp. NBRC 105346]